jgi:hypothetical protein
MLKKQGGDEVVWYSTSEKEWAAAMSLTCDNLSVYGTILSRTETGCAGRVSGLAAKV